MGLSPGTAVTGFPPAICNGVTHFTDPIALQAQLDLTTAYNDAQGRTNNRTLIDGELSGVTLYPGIYYSASGLFTISTTALTLDARGNAAGVFIFQAATTIATTGSVTLAGSASAGRIFWACGTSGSIGASSAFAGTMMADQSITVGGGAVIQGRLLARIAAITLDQTTITNPTAAAPSVSASPAASASISPSATATIGTSATSSPLPPLVITLLQSISSFDVQTLLDNPNVLSQVRLAFEQFAHGATTQLNNSQVLISAIIDALTQERFPIRADDPINTGTCTYCNLTRTFILLYTYFIVESMQLPARSAYWNRVTVGGPWQDLVSV
jgi:hypothetical protein